MERELRLVSWTSFAALSFFLGYHNVLPKGVRSWEGRGIVLDILVGDRGLDFDFGSLSFIPGWEVQSVFPATDFKGFPLRVAHHR